MEILEMVSRAFRKIFVPSQDTKERLAKHRFKHLSIWPRGVDRTIFHEHYQADTVRKQYQIKEKHILLYVGRLASEKDVMMLPEINQALPAHIKKDVHWLIVGDGPLTAELSKRAPNNMTLTGFVEGEELATIYAVSDLFVFPSASETFGNVVLEALSCGVPVVGANAGGVRTIVQDMKTGRLAEAKNTTAFTEAIVTLLENDQQRIEMSRAGISYAKQQSWESIFANLIDEYREVVGEEIYLEQELA